MEPIVLQETENTPRVLFDSKNGVFELTGRSLPADAPAFYTPLLAWMEAYGTHPNTDTELALRLEYINPESSKLMLDMFYILQKIKGSRVTWYFPEDDEDMEETGEDFAQLAGVPFELKAY